MSNEPRRGGWLSRDQALALCLIAGTALLVYLCWQLARPFLGPLGWAAVLAVVTHPLYRRIRRGLKRPGLAAGIGVAVVSLAIVVPAVFVSQQLLRQASSGIESLQTEVSRGRWRAAIQRNPRLGPIFIWVERQVGGGDAAKSSSAAIAARVPGFLSWSFRGVLELGIALLALFYFFRDDEAAVDTLRSLSPLPEGETELILARVAETIHATLYGTVVVAAIQGALGGLMFWWLGLPAPALWGIVMALLAIIPVLGPFVVWIPAAIFLALEGNWLQAVILVAWGAGVVALADNLVYPVLVGKRLRLHTLPIFVAILGGLSLMGAVGVFLGPVVLAIAVELLEAWKRRSTRAQT